MKKTGTDGGKMNLDSVKQTFVIESTELLDDMESGLLQLEKDPDNRDAVHAVFRAAHTIKGSSGMFGYKRVVEFTHVLESFLEELRQGKFSVNSDMIAILLSSGDHIKSLINLYMDSENPEISEDVMHIGEDLLTRLKKEDPTAIESSGDEMEETTDVVEEVNVSGMRAKNPNWHISLRFTQEVLRHGLDPISFINYLSGLGSLENVYTVTDQVPDSESVDPEACYLGFEISFKSDTSREEIEGVFEFLNEDAQIEIIEPRADMAQYYELISKVPEGSERMSEILIEMDVLTSEELENRGSQGETTEVKESTDAQEDVPLAGEEDMEIIPTDTVIEEPVEKVATQEPAIKDTEASTTVSETTAKFIRIEAGKLDSLINLVGELVINVANIRQLSEDTSNKSMVEASLTMGRLVEEVRDSAMNIRMVQIGDTFRRFERVVRDLSKKMGKEVNLKVTGGDTELDKTVVEKITDPLMHLIRNAVDHGISMPEKRKAAGKDPLGQIQVNAFHDTGNIVIEIVDDGEGLDRTAILNKAIANGVVPGGTELTDSEIHQLIFEPGLSTANEVTDVSGRGVGMDVVKKNIESLRGMVEVTSVPGKGTTIQIHLPLTLAIIDGFLVEIGKSSFVIPLDMVLECITLSEEDELEAEGGHFVNLRGEVLPYLRMKEFFQEVETDESQQNIIVVKYGQQKAGLVVDKLLGEFQTVIKPLGKIFNHVQGISGATILGDGSVAMILDIPRLIRFAQELESSHIVDGSNV